jgi:hypothetical protein
LTPPKIIKTDAPLQLVQTGHELERLRTVSDVGSVLTKSLGPFGSLIALICTTSFISIELVRSDIQAVVIGAIAMTAIAALCFYSKKDDKINSGPLSPS